jgi:hypothetical protein
MESAWEDSLLERKVGSDLKDLLKTLVAFANSVRPGHTAVILIGEKDDGTVQGVANPDSIQKKVREEADKIYPAIIWRTRVYEESGAQCVRVEIEYSGDTPHFGGPAWVRKGSETIKASNDVFQSLIDIRSDMVRELTESLNKRVTVVGEYKYFSVGARSSSWPGREQQEMTLVFVNKFWITLRDASDTSRSLPLSKIRLNFDNANNRLMLETLW